MDSVIFLGVMVVTLPLPATVTGVLPRLLVSDLRWFAFVTFALLLDVPFLLCIYQLATTSLGRTRKIEYVLEAETAPKIVVVMPVYNEKPDVLLTAVNSVVDCEYPSSCIHVFLSFDGDQIDEKYLTTLDRLGIPISMKDIPMSIDVAYNGSRVTVSRFPHGGKRKCQKATFKLIDKIYTAYTRQNDDLFILFIDSDCVLDKVCIQNFLYEMEMKPGSDHNILAMTGVITSTTEKQSLITLLQDMEYVHGQLFERSVESCCGAVSCLPGALTILRFSAFRKMAKHYFADKAEQCDDLFDFGKCHLGEDRWLTHLFMIASTHRYQIQMCASAFCKTEAVQDFPSLLKQRRRWFLGFITNEVGMMTDVRLWCKYPLLCVVRFMQNTIRTTSLLFLIMVISLCTTAITIENLPVEFIAVTVGLHFLLMIYFGTKIRRYKAWLYPLMFVVNPFFNWIYLVYGVLTAGKRTWGGPRADAAAADAKTSPQQAIEFAEATGDELNIVPETFRPAAEARAREPIRRRTKTLQPSESVVGRFEQSHHRSERWHRAQNSGLPLPVAMAHSRADSISSVESTGSIGFAIQTPRLVESLCERMEGKAEFGGGTSQAPSDTGLDSEYDAARAIRDQPASNTWTVPAISTRVNASEQRLRSFRAGSLIRHRFEADPEELHIRLSRLTVPRPTYNGVGPDRQGRSPLGRTSPGVVFNEEPPASAQEEHSNGELQTHGYPPKRGQGRRSSSERRRLQKRPPSAGSIV